MKKARTLDLKREARPDGVVLLELTRERTHGWRAPMPTRRAW